jgi:multicomponent Na+:H+ antiporter subunit G
MPDVFTRMHATSVSDTMGAGFLILGMIVQAGFTLITVKLLIILAIFFFTGPLTTHALARGALAVGLKPVLFDRGGRRRVKELKLIQEFGVVEVRDVPPARPTDPARAEKKAAAKKRKSPKSRSRKSSGTKGGSSSKR